jgi:Plasmid pRiA4b ORF-3-like protein
VTQEGANDFSVPRVDQNANAVPRGVPVRLGPGAPLRNKAGHSAQLCSSPHYSGEGLDHLWEFEGGDRRYGVPDPDWDHDSLLVAKNTKLKTLIERDIRQVLYTYDMGDNWEHIVTFEEVRQGEPGTKYPRYVEGRRRAPPEDCGGTPGFEAFLDAIANPKHPEHKHLTEWHHGCYGKASDPDEIDERKAKFTIAAIAKRRAAAKASQAKKST